MDYILEELERQRLAMERLLASAAERPETRQKSDMASECVRYGRGASWMSAADGPAVKSYGGETYDGRAAFYESGLMAGKNPAAELPGDEGGAEKSGKKLKKTGRRGRIADVSFGTAGGMEGSVFAAYEAWNAGYTEESTARVTALEVSRAVERDARRYDGHRQMY